MGSGNQIFHVNGKIFLFKGKRVILNRLKNIWQNCNGDAIPEFIGKTLNELPGVIESVLLTKATT